MYVLNGGHYGEGIRRADMQIHVRWHAKPGHFCNIPVWARMNTFLLWPFPRKRTARQSKGPTLRRPRENEKLKG